MGLKKNKEPVLTMIIDPPAPPEFLREAGAAEWTRVTTGMINNGNLAALFLPIIERLCKAIDKVAYIEKSYEKIMDVHGLMPQGKRTHPIFKMWILLDSQIARYYETLGMSPKSRRNANLLLAGNGGNPLANATKTGRPARPLNIDKDIFPIAKTG